MMPGAETKAPVFSKGRDLDATAAALAPWLAERLDGHPDEQPDGRVEVGEFSYPQGAGASNETILFEARRSADGRERVDELVLRVAPRPEYQMFLEPEFRMQYDLLATLRGTGSLRVPEVLWFEDDPAILGARFFVMRRMRGRVPVSMPVYNKTGWVVDATPAQRRTLWESAVRQLAAIHLVPVDTVAFVDRPQRGATGHEQQLTYWSEFATWALGDAVPDVVAAVLDWLTANAPPQPEPGLSWGDARMGNMMFGDDFEVVGVMDWEQASLAGPMTDLGWWLFFDDIHSVEQGLARLDGLGTRQETIDLWEELTGQRVGDLLWHEVFAGCKAGLLALRSRDLLTLAPSPGGRRPNPFLAKSCRLLDLPVPEEMT
jgi:aminoglycoside phosphotransferase (APT) family kinase protein